MDTPALRPAAFDRDAGYRLMRHLEDAETQTQTLPWLDDLAPGFADWIVTSLFGGTYQREGLTARDRQVATVAALTALGGVEPQLAGHAETSRRVGMTAAEVVEIVVHLAPYVGVPKALAALRAIAPSLEAYDERDAVDRCEANR
jgi:4-carboxymuconolactone decarboxylase